MGEEGVKRGGGNDKDDPAGNRVGLLCFASRCVALPCFVSIHFASLCCASLRPALLRFASFHLVVVISLLGSVQTHQARPRPDPTPTRPDARQKSSLTLVVVTSLLGSIRLIKLDHLVLTSLPLH